MFVMELYQIIFVCFVSIQSIGCILFQIDQGTVFDQIKLLRASHLAKYAVTACLNGTLAQQGPFTVFAPTDDAFKALPSTIQNDLANNKSFLEEVLKYHIVDGKFYSSQLRNEMLLTSLQQDKIRINIYNNGHIVTASGSKVVQADQSAMNGVIHVMDSVMYPLPVESLLRFAITNRNLSTLVQSVLQASLTGILAGPGPFTLFAPINTAFDKLPAGMVSDLYIDVLTLREVLRNHLLSGTFYSKGLKEKTLTTLQGTNITTQTSPGGLIVKDAKVVHADITVNNGVVHLIDTVLLLPRN